MRGHPFPSSRSATFMSDFSSLKKQRKAREPKSYVVASPIPSTSIHDLALNAENEPNPDAMKLDKTPSPTEATMTAEVVKTEGLYKTLPEALDIRVSANGRGIYSQYHRKPGECIRRHDIFADFHTITKCRLYFVFGQTARCYPV